MTRFSTLMLILVVAVQVGLLAEVRPGILSGALDSTPLSIRQGPIGTYQAPSGDPYWYQTGAMGDSSTSNYVAANVTIRTVYDKVNGDAHSYWVGGYLSNGAFIQVGYLNEVTTTNQPFCCAWFFEYFPSPGSGCCAPVIGRQGSAGPIGSWHTYSMVHAGNGVWSFYMDGRLLGSTPATGATSSGGHSPGVIAEVAQASNNTDVLGPAEFRDMWFRTATSSWQRVPGANSYIYYGSGTPPNPPPNPYGVVEVEGVKNDFLVGSYIPQLNPPSPTPGTSLWTPTTIPPPNPMSLNFLDNDQLSFTPTWVSLRESSTSQRVFYTQYQNQRIDSGNWVVDRVIWHSVDVKMPGPSIQVPGTTNATVQGNVFSVRMHVVGLISGLPVNGATVFGLLPDTLNVTVRTDSSGEALLSQLPPASYLFRVTLPFGIAAIVNQNVAGPIELTARVLSTVEMFLIIALPILGAVAVVVVAVWRDRLRRASMPTIPPSHVVANNCTNCGYLLHATDSFCPNCGTPVKPPMA